MKMLLIATTALVCVTSLVTAGTLPDRQAGSGHSGPDTNEEFLCNYGFTIHKYFSDSEGYYNINWVRAATPVIGKGKTVNEITIEDGPAYSFQVAIYSSYQDKPRKLLVENEQSHVGCSRVNVPISPIMLKMGEKYWVVESAVNSSSGTNSFVWLYDRKRTHGALQQSGYSCNWSICGGHPSIVHHHISRWKPIKGGVPYAKVGQSVEASELNRPAQSLAAGGGSLSPVIVPTGRGDHQGSIPRNPP